MTATTDIPRPRFARMYVKAAARADRRGAAEHRRRLLEGLTGRVVEVGAGNGLNFAHYPTSVNEVIAIEPEPSLREAAQELASQASVAVTVRAGSAESLPLGDGEVDAAAGRRAALLRARHPALPANARDPATGRPQRALARHCRRLPPSARHRSRDQSRRLYDRALRALRLQRQSARAERPAYPRNRAARLNRQPLRRCPQGCAGGGSGAEHGNPTLH
jgi:hypothetical protein